MYPSYCRSFFCRAKYTVRLESVKNLSCTAQPPYRYIITICFKIEPTCARSIKIRIGMKIIFSTPCDIFMPTILVDSSTICIRSGTIWDYHLTIDNSSDIFSNPSCFLVIYFSDIIAILSQSIYYLLCWSIACSFPNTRKCGLYLCSSSSNSSNTIRNSHACIIMIMTRKYKIMFFS